MITIEDKDLDCGCCLEFTIAKNSKQVVIQAHSIIEALDKALPSLE
jgi:hypothetical protein